MRRRFVVLLISLPMIALCLYPSDGASARNRRYSEMLSPKRTTPGAGYATGNGEQVSQPATGSRAPDPLDVKDTIEFFTWYLKTKESMTRGEFETDAAYQKRLPPPFDSRKTIYFRVQRGLYRYDLATQTLTLTDSLRQPGGDSYKRAKAEYARAIQRYDESIGSGAKADKPTIPQPGDFEPWYEWNILTSISSDAVYIAQNAFGASVAVHAYTMECYQLAFVNGGSIPGEVSEDVDAVKYEYYGPSSKKKVAFSFNLAPEEAERVSQAYEIVLGVSLLGYTQSDVESSRPLRPTLKSPSDWTFVNFSIQAVLREVIVRDKFTKSVLRRLPTETPLAPKVD